MTELKLNQQRVRIDTGELVGYQLDGHEYIHQKGSPGWRSADAEMFPIIGPTNEANFKVYTPKGEAIQDQHGLLREMEYRLVSSTDTTAIFEKKYTAGTRLKNSKYPAKSTAERLYWPYNFTFQKKFELQEKLLEISFIVGGDTGMPFMLGYHPAFKLHSKTPQMLAHDKKISLPEVLAVGSRAMPVLDSNYLLLQDQKNVHIKTEGFNHFMLWTEVTNMVCLEPIIFYPYAIEQKNLQEGFQFLTDKEHTFKVQLILEG